MFLLVFFLLLFFLGDVIHFTCSVHFSFDLFAFPPSAVDVSISVKTELRSGGGGTSGSVIS